MSYADLLLDPRWQRKRLEVLERADFTCEECGDKSTTLHVHHGYYEKGKKPWEYPHDSLHCVCAPCHLILTQTLAEMQRLMGGAHQSNLDFVVGFARAEMGDHMRPIRVRNAEQVCGVARAYRMSEEEIEPALDIEKGQISREKVSALLRSREVASA